ncbi:MAG: hypothetical protein JJU05_12685 [Verrucomicrobia bacterium]|nr:hypothetical protein [Verrucomicrobiota bacterium]MCH8528374.1 hypothetical protein [Kiritimatiellia bacterium]
MFQATLHPKRLRLPCDHGMRKRLESALGMSFGRMGKLAGSVAGGLVCKVKNPERNRVKYLQLDFSCNLCNLGYSK